MENHRSSTSRATRRRSSFFTDSLTHSHRRRSSIEVHMQHYYESVEHVEENEVVTGWTDSGLAITAEVPEEKKENCIHDVIEYMLVASQLIYNFAWLRKLAKQSDECNMGWLSWAFGKKKEKVQFKHEDLILAEKAEGDDDPVRFLKKDVHACDVTKFIEENLLLHDKDGQTSKDEAYEMFETLESCKEEDQYLAEFDDAFADKECVYAIVVNRTQKMVVIVFRGSVTGADWQTNFNTFLGEIDTPGYVREAGFTETIRVHSGFKSYLFDGSLKGTAEEPRDKQKFDDIIDDLKRVYGNDMNRGFELFVTGHSLGGALCTLVGFKLAGSDRELLPKRINIISFAAPKLGDNSFNKAFQLLEKSGRIRAIRVSNQGDAIPVAPPSMWPFLHGFTQTGVNLHLHTNGILEAGHRNLKSFYSQTCTAGLQNHKLMEYHARLRQEANLPFLYENTMEDLYALEAAKGCFEEEAKSKDD